MRNHWNNAVLLRPHTIAMRDRANELWAEATCKADANEVAQTYIYQPADIEFLQCCAADLERWSLAPVGFAEAPDCTCTPRDDIACPACQERAQEYEYDWISGFMDKLPRLP